MYLCDKYSKHDWYPTETRQRARVNEYANWQHLNLRANGAMLFATKVKIRVLILNEVNTRFLCRLLHLV